MLADRESTDDEEYCRRQVRIGRRRAQPFLKKVTHVGLGTGGDLLHRLSDLVACPRVAIHVQQYLHVSQILWPAVMSQQNVYEMLDPLRGRVAFDVCVLYDLDEVSNAILEYCEHQALSRPEVVLDDTPGDPGASGDLICARPVEPTFENAGHGGINDQPLCGCIAMGRASIAD